MKRLDRKIEIKAQALHTYIVSLPIVQEYQEYEKYIKNNIELHQLEVRIKALQKKIVQQRKRHDDRLSITEQAYKNAKDRFDNDPMVVNFLYLQEQVDSLLQYINMRINGALSNIE